MKKSNYENSMFPLSLDSTVNFHAWRSKDKCYLNVSSPPIHDYSQKKAFFFQNYMTNVAKI